MNALRTLPILNRPSRPASPAPPSTQTTTATAQPPSALGLGIVQSHSEPGKPRSRSLSRAVADKVSSMQHAQANGHVTVPMPAPAPAVKGSSPPGSRPPTPRTPGVALPGAPVENGTAPQAGYYMDALGMRLNEAVTKASVKVDWKAKKGFNKGSGWTFGENILKELPYPSSDAYLMRAVLRTAVRSLTIFITRLESLLLPALTDPLFSAQLNLATPGPHTNPLNPVQYYALSVAHAAWETCEVLEQSLETREWPRFVGEALRPPMDKLDLVVGKVVQPLLLGLKKDLTAALNRTEGVSPVGGKSIGLAHTPAPASAAAAVPVTKENSQAPLGRLTKEVSGGGHARQLPVPVVFQYFASKVDGAKKVLDIVAGPCADDGEGWVTGVVVAVVWKGMCIVSERDIGPPGARPPSPGSVSKALNNLKLDEKAGSTPVQASASLGHKLTTILPSRTASRPPSPPHKSVRWDPMTHALMSLEGLVKRLVIGLVEPCPEATATTDNPGPEHIAREALHEAIEALTSLRTVSAAMHSRSGQSGRMLASSRRIRDDIDDDAEETLDDAMEDVPAVTLLTVFLRQANASLLHIPIGEKSPAAADLHIRSPAELWGWSVTDYERQVLGGFAQAEEWGKRVAVVLKPEIERVMASLASVVSGSVENGEKGSREQQAVVGEAQEWVRALGVCCEARGGVRIASAT